MDFFAFASQNARSEFRGATTMASKKVQQIDGSDCFGRAIQMARHGHCDWIVWSDSSGSHAARKSQAILTMIVETQPDHWSLISANDGVPMKGFPYLASNMLKQLEMGWA